MLPRERIYAVLAGKTPDCVPLFPKISFATSQWIPQMSVIDYMSNAQAMADALLTSAQRFHYDGIGVTVGICNEGMALGSQYEALTSALPKLTRYLLTDVSQWQAVPCPNPHTTEPLHTILQAISLLHQANSGLFLTAWCNGPLNIASQLLPLEDLLCGMLEDPESTHALLQQCTNFACRCAKAMIAAGADGISIGHATASCTVISPTFYQEFALPYEKQIVNAIHQAGGVAITHICGNIMPIASYIAQNNSELIDCDHMCNPIDVLQNTGKVIRGNIDPALLAGGTPKEVYEAAKQLLLEAKHTKRFLLGSGCEINLGTPAENMEALARARHDYGSYDTK